MYQFDVSLGPAYGMRHVSVTVRQDSAAAAQARIVEFMHLVGAEDLRFSEGRKLQDKDVKDLQLDLSSGLLDIEMLPDPQPDQTLHDYASISGGKHVFALIDPAAVLEADTLAELHDVDLRQLVWDEDPEIDAQAPYLVGFGEDTPFDTLLLTRTAETLAGIWDRQSPFVIITNRTAAQIAQVFQDWMRPAAPHIATPPFLRLWQGTTVPALMLSGDMTCASLPGDVVLGVGPPDYRQMLKLSPRVAHGSASVDSPRISEAAQTAIAAAHRAERHRMRAGELHDNADAFKDVFALVSGCYWLGDQAGMPGVKFEQVLSQLSHDYGWGFMYDAQYPALQEVLAQVRHVTPVHLRALLLQWGAHIAARAGPPDAARERKRLSDCYDLVRADPDRTVITLEDLTAIDPAKQKLHSAANWGRVLDQWRVYFAPMENDVFDLRTLCLLAYSTGQYMMNDPVRRARISQVFGHPLPHVTETSNG